MRILPHGCYHIDDVDNMKGSGVRILLEGFENLLIEQSLKFKFEASNNKAKYKAFITSMTLT